MPMMNSACDYADKHGSSVLAAAKGPDTAYPFYPLDAQALSYSPPEFNIVMPFRPTELPVNPQINRVLVGRAIRLLDPLHGERVADMFCGLGNFSRRWPGAGDRAWHRGSQGLVERARATRHSTA